MRCAYTSNIEKIEQEYREGAITFLEYADKIIEVAKDLEVRSFHMALSAERLKSDVDVALTKNEAASTMEAIACLPLR